LNKISIVILFLIFILVIVLIFWLYFFNIYEAKIFVNPKALTINSNSKVVIEIIPLNSFGIKALFRTIPINYEIISGKELIEIENVSKNVIHLYSKGSIGEAEILIIPSIGLFPTKIKIPINLQIEF